MKRKNILDYMILNSNDLNYIVATEVYYEKEQLKNKILKMQDINKFANYLFKVKSKKIGILLENSNEFVMTFYSIILNNKIPVSINVDIQIEELDDIILKNSLDIIITNSKFMELVNKTNIEKIINVDNTDTSNEDSILNFIPHKKSEEDIFVVSYTSGTSGSFSKGVELTYKNITFVSKEYKKIYHLSKNTKIITVLPLWHNYSMFACLTSSIVSKSSLILMKNWNAKLFLEINKKYSPEIFPGSPYMYIDLITNYSSELTNLKNLKICDSGGDTLPIECIHRFEKMTNAVITEGYGLTETSSLTHFNYNASERKVGSLGKPVTYTKCKILDMEGNELPSGEWGLLWIKGPMVFKDYVGLPHVTKQVKKNGWFNTNDVVKKDDNGYYYLAGRLSDLKGLNKNDDQLKKLENELYKFPGINRVHINANYNSIANFYDFNIIVVLKEEYKPQDLYDYINLNLKQYVIGNIKFVKSLPTTGTGKVKRNKITDILNFNMDDYKKEELSGGLRCKTLLLSDNNNKLIYQEYNDGTKYQAQKKYNITNLIKNQNKKVLIPNAYEFGEDNDKTWLLTEYKDGKTLNDLRKENFSLKSVSRDIAKTLYQIHSVEINSNDYGWITDKGVIKYDSFSEYLENELIRFSTSVKQYINKTDYNYMINQAQYAISKIKLYENKMHPQLIWFDLNPNNILIRKSDDKYQLSSIIDAGGAKYGIKEWDLAFIKMEVCLNKDEFDSILNEYRIFDKTVDEQLIEYLTIFVELDDMIIRILDGEELPIPYDTNFKNIIDRLSK